MWEGLWWVRIDLDLDLDLGNWLIGVDDYIIVEIDMVEKWEFGVFLLVEWLCEK